jgi:putative membrane protein
MSICIETSRTGREGASDATPAEPVCQVNDNEAVNPDASWTPDPGVLAIIVLTGAAYFSRWRRARAHSGPRGAGIGRLACFAAGLLVVAVALVSPVDRLADQLFPVHMLQHVLLLDVAPIMLILGLTKVLLRPATRRLVAVERAVGWLAHPAFAIVLYVAVMWVWHVPALYDSALSSAPLHALEHACMAWAGGLYWWHLLSPIRGRLRLGGMGPAVYMACTKVLVGLLGIVLAFGPAGSYGAYAHLPHYWGLSPSDGQAAAGLVMALEQSLIMGVALAILFVRVLAESERREQRSERYV